LLLNSQRINEAKVTKVEASIKTVVEKIDKGYKITQKISTNTTYKYKGDYGNEFEYVQENNFIYTTTIESSISPGKATTEATNIKGAWSSYTSVRQTGGLNYRLYKRIKKVPRIFVLVQHQKNEEYVTKTS
jgi:hypothetical protein